MQHNATKPNIKLEKLTWSEYWVPYIGLFIAWLTAHQLIRFFVRMRVVDTQNVRKAEELAKERGVGIIFAMNHTSQFDPFFVTAASTPYYSSYPMFYVTGNMHMYQERQGGLSTLMYNSFIFKSLGSQYLKSGKKDYSVSLERHTKLLRAGRSVCIFPEGQISLDGALGDAHGGVGYLALETGSIVVPINVTDAWSISFREFFTRKRHVDIHYGEPIYDVDFNPEESSGKNKYQQYADLVIEKIVQAARRPGLQA